MSGEVQQHIQKFLFHLSNQDHEAADQSLKQVIDLKHQERFDAAYESIAESTKPLKEETDQSIHNLVKWINSHSGVKAVFMDGKLHVTGEVRHPDGKLTKQTDIIEPSVKAARNWLGY